MDNLAPTAWLAETQRRLTINEGLGLRRYRDSRFFWTLGLGYNLERGDAATMLAACGIDYAAVMADQPITVEQADKLFARCFAPIVGEASASLAPGIFSALSDARRFVLCDLDYNLGAAGWLAFGETRSLINAAQTAKIAGTDMLAHSRFSTAADHLAASPWASQTGRRAMRDIAMLRSGGWVDANGDGSV